MRRLCPSYFGILQSAEPAIGYDGDCKYGGRAASNPTAITFPKGLMGSIRDIDMWTETKFDVTRRETSTKRPFGEVGCGDRGQRAGRPGIPWTR
jgi:hypothetical protein